VTEKSNHVNGLASSVEQEKSKKRKEGKKAEARFCKDCKFYDKSTEREFHRKVGKKDEHGKRAEIVEVRAICRNPKASSFGHLVMAEYSKRQCPVWEKASTKLRKALNPKNRRRTMAKRSQNSKYDMRRLQ